MHVDGKGSYPAHLILGSRSISWVPSSKLITPALSLLLVNCCHIQTSPWSLLAQKNSYFLRCSAFTFLLNRGLAVFPLGIPSFLKEYTDLESLSCGAHLGMFRF